MNKKVYELEVGVLLDKTDDEWNYYNIKATKETGYGYYDENHLVYLDYNKAKNYADYYVNNGVVNTYAFIYENTYNLTKEDWKEIDFYDYFTDFEIPVKPKKDWLYYIWKNQNGEIVKELEE